MSDSKDFFDKKKLSREKLTIRDIKKNSSSDVSHTIRRIKLEEKRIVTYFVLIILLIVFVVGIIVFPVLSGNKQDVISSGPLKIQFIDNEMGMSDIVNFTERDGNPGEEGVVVNSTVFTITNDSSASSWYAVYLDDYVDMIEFDNCSDKQFDKDMIYFSIDNSEAVMLSSVDYGGRYVLTEGIISANSKVTHEVRIFHMDYSEDHYHGKIVVKYLR